MLKRSPIMPLQVRLKALLFLLLPLAAVADQAAIVDEAIANKALEAMQEAPMVRHYCEPCGDTTFREEPVGSVYTHAAEGIEGHEVYVNDMPVDLAYVYIEQEGDWRNVALLLGLPVSDVSATLPDTVSGAVEDSSPTHLLGTLGDKLKFIMVLQKFGEEVTGTYTYLHVGEPIRLEGSITPDGKFTMSEFAGEEKSGIWKGALQPGLKSLTANWESTDGTKQLEAKADRVAVQAGLDQYANVNGWSIAANAVFPMFPSDEKAVWNETIAAHVQDMIGEFMSQHVSGSVTMDAPPMVEEAHSTLGIAEFVIADYNKDLLSVVFTVYSYGYGAAHGNTAYDTLTLLGNKPLTLSGIIDHDTALAPLSTYLLEDLKQQGAQSVVDGEVSSFKAEELEAFTVSPAGIRFYFAPYAVGPYAQGAFEVLVPMEIAKPWLREEIRKLFE